MPIFAGGTLASMALCWQWSTIPSKLSVMNVVLQSIRPRVASSVRSLSLAVKYNAHGQAKDVYKLEKVGVLGNIGASEVGLKFLAAPINPSDLNLAEGTYGVKATLPAVGGNEGVATVTQVGSGVKSLKVGDWVVPIKTPFGTWRQEAKAEEDALVKVPNDIPAPYAATLTINPATAYCMLREFEKLSPGDVVIQNGGNSMVGQAVIQLAREMGLKTINVVRTQRPEVETALKLMTNLGGDVNVPDHFVGTASFNEILKDLPPVKLALNCIGGSSATDLARVLAPGGTLVTYGGMSKDPLTIPHDLIVHKQLKLRGFWIADWYAKHSREEASVMLNDIAGLVRDKRLFFFYRMHDIDDFPRALEKATEPFQNRKVVLDLQPPDRFKEHDARPESDYEVFDGPSY